MTARAPTRRARAGLVLGLSAASAFAAWLTTGRPSSDAALTPAADSPSGPATTVRRPAGALTIALAGDAALSTRIDVRDPAVQPVAALLRQASVTLANFELAAADLSAAADRVTGPPRWPTASPSAAADLRALGVTAVSLANDHVFDRGADGLADLRTQLAGAGLVATGAGENLDAARTPAIVETPDGAVAILGLTLTFDDGARASPRRGAIVGRAGVNGLRYSRRLRVDPAAFARLRTAFQPPAFTANADGRTWTLHGIPVEPASRGGMALVADAGDLEALTSAVRELRARAAAVVVSLHAHEPGPAFDEVTDLAQVVARAAIDAGADVVHGHGPHRLRGVEVYRGRPIFYSLGSVVFPDGGITPQAAGPFEDHRWDVRSPLAPDGLAVADFTDPVWRQGAVAVVRFASGRVSADLHALDLGIGLDIRRRGRPALAEAAVADAIYARLARLSAPFGTALNPANGRAGVVIP